MARGVVRVGGGGEGGGEGVVEGGEGAVVWCGQVVLRWLVGGWYDGGGGVCGEGGAVWRRWRIGGVVTVAETWRNRVFHLT